MCKSFSRGLSGDMGVTLGSRWLSSGLIVMGGSPWLPAIAMSQHPIQRRSWQGSRNLL